VPVRSWPVRNLDSEFTEVDLATEQLLVLVVAATGATTTTTAARQLLRGRSHFRGEWEHIPCLFFWRAHALEQA
jgi:hypothetical protein